MRCDRGMFAAVQVVANLGRCMRLMIEIRDEGRDRALKVDVVFPKRVVGINEQRLAGLMAEILRPDRHIWIIEGLLSTQ